MFFQLYTACFHGIIYAERLVIIKQMLIEKTGKQYE